MKKLDKLPSEMARDYAIRAIRENIVSLDLKPGTAISENEIAGTLGLSRTPVREAIQELKKAYIVEIFPQKGCYVSLIDSNLVEEARFLRKVLDTAVIEKACDLATEEDIAQLEENVMLQEFYLNNAAANRIYELDNDFHRMIYSTAKKDMIYTLRFSIMIHFDRVRSLSMTTVKDMKIVNDHRQMLEAIKGKDKELAKQLVEKHLNRYQIDEAQIRASNPEYFKIE